MPTVTILRWTPRRANTLRGFIDVSLPSGMIVRDLTLHMHPGGRVWVGMPGKPRLLPDGTAKRDTRGKVEYDPVIEWADRGISDRFTSTVVAALRTSHPEAVAEVAETST